MAIVTQQQLEDAAEDALTLQEVANEPANVNGDGIIYSRLGLPIKVVQKVIADAEAAVATATSYTDRGAWVGPGRDYDIKDLVQESGTTYISVTDHTSTGSFTTDKAAGNWGIFQTQFPEYHLSSYASLSAAIAAIGSTASTLVLDVPSVLAGAVVSPATLSIRPLQGNVISGAYTWTHSGPIVGAGRFQWLSPLTTLAGDIKVSVAYPEWHGFIGNGVADDLIPLERVHSLGVSVLYPADKQIKITDNITATYTKTTTLDFNGCEFLLGTHFKALYTSSDYHLTFNINGGDLYVKNFQGDCQSTTFRPMGLYSLNDDSSVFVSNYRIKNVFWATAYSTSTGTAIGLSVKGPGKVCGVENFYAENFDTNTGNTIITALRVNSTGTNSFEEVVIETAFGTDITEQGGGEYDDSDFISVFNFRSDPRNTLLKCSNVEVTNSTGKSLKRVVKAQTDYAEISNIRYIGSNSKLRYMVDVQMGSADIKNIFFNGTNVDLYSFVAASRLTGTNSIQDGVRAIKNIFAYGTSNTLDFFAFETDDGDMYAGGYTKSQVDISNVKFNGLTGAVNSGFLRIGGLTEYVANFENINTGSTAFGRGLIYDYSGPTPSTKCRLTAKNFESDVRHRLTNGSGTEVILEEAINCRFENEYGNTGTWANRKTFSSRCRLYNNKYKYSASTHVSILPNPTTLILPAAANANTVPNYGTSIRFDFAGQRYGAYTKCSFVAIYIGSTDSWTIGLLDEQSVGSAIFDTPVLSWVTGTKKLSVNFTNYLTSSLSYVYSLEIDSTIYFEVDELLGFPTH